MLSYMRKNASSWIIKVLFTIIVIVFVFFYGFNEVRKKESDAIASVGDRKISMAEYKKAYNNMLQFYRNIYQKSLSAKNIEDMGLKQKTLEDLIDREILLQEAEHLNIKATPEQVRKAIIETQTFQENGIFSPGLYKRMLSYNGVSAKDFEKAKERELLIKILENLVKNSVIVSEEEIREVYNLQKEKVKIEYIKINPENIKEEPLVSQEELNEYFEKNKAGFRVPEKARVKYIIFDPKTFEQKVDVSDKEIEEYYEQDMEQFFEPEQVKAKHILLIVKKDASEKEVAETRKKALDILDQLNKGEKFETLAKKYSEDPSSAEKGGDLGYFKKGQMVKPFEETAFSLKPGETSSPVRTQFGFHIIQVEDKKQARTKPLEEVKSEIEEDIRKEKAQELVKRTAKRAYNRLFKDRNIEKYATENDLELLETGYFVFGKAPEDRPGKEVFSEETFLLSPGEMAPAFAIGQRYFLLKLVDKKESHIPSVEEVKSEIEKEVKKKKRLQMAKDKADKILSQLISGEEKWDGLEKKYGLKVEEVELHRQGDFVSGIGSSKELKKAAFALDSPGSFAATCFQTDRGIFLVRLKEKTGTDDAEFEKEKDKTAQTVLQEKRKEAFDRYLQKLKARTEIWVDNRLF